MGGRPRQRPTSNATTMLHLFKRCFDGGAFSINAVLTHGYFVFFSFFRTCLLVVFHFNSKAICGFSSPARPPEIWRATHLDSRISERPASFQKAVISPAGIQPLYLDHWTPELEQSRRTLRDAICQVLQGIDRRN